MGNHVCITLSRESSRNNGREQASWIMKVDKKWKNTCKLKKKVGNHSGRIEVGARGKTCEPAKHPRVSDVTDQHVIHKISHDTKNINVKQNGSSSETTIIMMYHFELKEII